MENVQEYWRRVRGVEARLPDTDVYLVSLDNPGRCLSGGVVVQVARENAARCIADETHRVATDDEMASYEAEQDRRRLTQRADALRAAGVCVVQVGPLTKARGVR